MLTYEELLEKYRMLLKENAALKAEIAVLKGVAVPLERVEDSVISDRSIGVCKYSSPADKITLFRSLFLGREDVFARRWYSKTTEKSGYQPVCRNEWDNALCDKKKYKCSTCPNRTLLPLTDKDIYRHLSGNDLYGRDVVGIYPMLHDETVHFCCIDFDDDGFEVAAKAFYASCAKTAFPLILSAHAREAELMYGYSFPFRFQQKPLVSLQAEFLH